MMRNSMNQAGINAVQIPRATCRLFGVIKAIGLVKNCVVLVHGPKGCVYHINYILGMRGSRPSRIYSTCLDEKDVIFGAEKKLRTAIEELDAEHHPDLIAVLSCCATSIIGEDVVSAALEAEAGAHVLAISSGGFEGDHRSGYAEALVRLVEEFAESGESVDPRAVNLVGILRGGPDLRELVRILGLIGVRVNAVLTAGTTVPDITRIPLAALNVVLCEPAGIDAAEFLKGRFGMPYISIPLPMGYEATRGFLEKVGKALDIPVIPADIPIPPSPGLHTLDDQRIAIIGGPTRAISLTHFLQELGCEPVLIAVDHDAGCLSGLRTLVSPGVQILIEPLEEEIERKLRDLGVTLILGGMLERPVADELGIRSIDIMHGCAQTVGIEGAEHLCRVLREK
jgi:nitrogenase molybdenum-iron protein alpha/beta subunit